MTILAYICELVGSLWADFFGIFYGLVGYFGFFRGLVGYFW